MSLQKLFDFEKNNQPYLEYRSIILTLEREYLDELRTGVQSGNKTLTDNHVEIVMSLANLYKLEQERKANIEKIYKLSLTNE